MRDTTSISNEMEDQRQFHLSIDLTLDLEEITDNTPLITIERTWSKLRDLELRLNGVNTSGLELPSPNESHDSDPLSRFLSESTEDGFFHTIGQVHYPAHPIAIHPKQYKYQSIHHASMRAEDVSSEAFATCGLMSEISRGLSRL
ncbi:hypothetical protein H072_1283 [Dactylellina haptotyla CBS 200.50]|uniref:Uncharacterized protein n=1 Tax=Dactylellina haptotyla (strain CBS 200.50) TaxID=1284197 RepID=S8AP39_DACHA|nr:hypothetical protein H072_1283 [Dactylellina haptotyla CBS 200.50]